MTDRKPLLPILPFLAAALVLRPLPSTAFQASVFDGDVVISEFAAATSDRVVYWPEDGSAPRLGMGIPWTDLTYNDADQALSEAYTGGTLAGLNMAWTYDSALRRDTVTAKSGGTTQQAAT